MFVEHLHFTFPNQIDLDDVNGTSLRFCEGFSSQSKESAMIPIGQVFEAWAQMRLFRAGAVEAVDDQGRPTGTKFYGTAIGGMKPGSGAKVLGPLEQIVLDPDNLEHLRIAQEAVDRAKGRVTA
jgi:hypothetical protein